MIKKIGWIFKTDWFPPTFFFLISSLITFLWFRDGNYLGGGEANLPTWNAGRLLSVYQFSWIDFGLGYPSPFWLPRLPLYFLTSLLSNLFSQVVVEAIVFLALIFIGGLGMYLLTKYLTRTLKKKNNNLIPLLAGLFYILNLYTQSQVWARFIFAGFFAWSSLPLFLFLWISWLEKGSYRYLLLFLFFSFFTSTSFSHPAFLFAFWLVAILFLFFKLIIESNYLAKKNLVLKSLLGIVCWLIFNLWWIYPYIKLQSSVVSNIHDWKYDLASLVGVSVDSTVKDVLLLRHKFFFERLDYWGKFYQSGLSYLISLLILAISFLGLVKARVLKEYKYLVVLIVIGFFVCKGTNPPFGNTIFGFLFEYVPLARVFRSSYEKFGTVWLMTYSILFAYGFGFLYQTVSKIWKFILVSIFLPLFLLILPWPMWNSGPFSPQARINIPEYYNVADEYLSDSDIEGRILTLPIIPGEGVKYNWADSSYYGLEPSDVLFSRPAISKTVRYKPADEKYNEIYEAFTQKRNIDNLLSETNVKYLVLHNELEPSYSNASSAAEVRETLKEYPSIKFLKSVENLDIYIYTKFVPNSQIVIEGEVEYGYKKVNPGHYVVKIVGARKPFKLILKDSFSPIWTAKINGGRIPDHFVAYNYANGWEVREQGNYTIDLIFEVWPEIFPGTY